MKYPGEDYEAGRPLKTSPTYPLLRSLGASFGEKAGWERANWFATNEDVELGGARPRGWAGEHWSTAIPAEHRAAREVAALFDETSFAKLEVAGPGAVAFLQWICANDVDVDEGRVVYTQMLNRRGGIQADLTVTRLSADRFRIVTGTASGSLDLAWIGTQLDRDDVEVTDVTERLGCLGLWGPKAREILGDVTSADLSNRAFPFMTSREIAVGPVTCRALRVTYVGELGWELYPSMDQAATLWEMLLDAGRPHGLVPAGYRAIDSLRLEKAYRAWGSDVTPDDTPLEAGLGFAIVWDKDFLGKEALERQRSEGIARSLRIVALDETDAMCLGNEPVFADDRVVSRVTSGGIGYTTRTSIALTYLPLELAEPGTALEIEVFGDRVKARVAAEPPYDPKGERVKT